MLARASVTTPTNDSGATPKFKFVFVYVNVFDDGVDETVKSPLYPELPTPVVLVELLTLLILTLSPILNLCGISVVTTLFVESLASVPIPAMILGLRLVIILVIALSSPTVLDSCNT